MNITYTDKAKLLPPHKPITTRYTDSDTATLLPLHRANTNNMNHHRLGEGRAAAGQQISEHTHTHTHTVYIMAIRTVTGTRTPDHDSQRKLLSQAGAKGWDWFKFPLRLGTEMDRCHNGT